MSVTPLRNHAPRDSSPGLLLDSMQDIEAELERLMNEWSSAEQALVRANGQVERLAAPRRLQLKRENLPAKQGGPTKEDLDAMVLDWLWDEHEQEMEDQLDAEANCAAFKTIYRCAESALSSKQSRLKADLALEDVRRRTR